MNTTNLLKLLNNPQIYEIGKFAPRAAKTIKSTSNNKQLEINLDGTWHFEFYENLEDRDQYFFSKTNFSHKITIPSHIELNGYGQIQYVNTQYPWDGIEDVNVGTAPLITNTCGQYTKFIEIEDIQSYSEYILSFEGVESCFNLWVNGNHVGYSTDAFTTAEFVVKDYLKTGTNQISVEVYKFSASSWLDDQDFWRFSGIFRSVELKQITNEHIIDYSISYEISDNQKVSGIIQLEKNNCFNVSVDIYHMGVLLEQIDSSDNTINFDLDAVDLWSAEIPNLYTFVFKTETEIFEKQVGFRTIEIDQNIIKINGKRIVFKGINRHEFDCYNGRAISYDQIYSDLLLLKQHNFNAIRCSHYPNNTIFYDLCDTLGFYVINEVNLETHGTWQVQGESIQSSNILPDNNEDYRLNVLSRASNLYERDKNSTSVVIWSLGNESYGGETLYQMHNYFKQIDPSRLTHYEGIFWDRRYPKTSDIESQMYTSAENIEKFIIENNDKPFILCEFSHAMGNSNGNFQDYLDLEDKYQSYQGGFIWEYMDQALYIDGRFFYGGDFDECPSDYNFICDGLVGPNREVTSELLYISNLYSPLKINETDKQFIISNTNVFKDFKQLELRIFNQTASSTKLVETTTISIAAGQSLKIAKRDSNNVILYQLFDNNLLLKEFSTATSSTITLPTNSTATFVDGDHNFSLSGDNFKIVFSKVFNNIISINYEGNELINSFEHLPQPNFWRAPTNNDIGAKKHKEFAIWNAISKYQEPTITSYSYNNHSLVVNIDFSTTILSDYKCNLQYTVNNSGAINVKTKYYGIPNVPDFFEFGLKTRLNQRYKYCTYLGAAGIDSYCDRNTSLPRKYSKFKINEQYSYLYPQEFGNKTNVEYLQITTTDNRGFIISSPAFFEFSILPYSDEQLEGVSNRNDLCREAPQLKINYKQAGVAGDNSWGAWCKPEHCLSSATDMEFDFTINRL